MKHEDINPSSNEHDGRLATKEAIIAKYYDLKGNLDLSPVWALQEEIEAFTKSFGDDSQLGEVYCFCELLIAENQHFDLGACIDLAAPLIYRLLDSEDWDFFDVRLSTIAIMYSKNYEELHFLAQRAIEAINQFTDEQWCNRRKMAIYTNVTGRLLKSKFFEHDSIDYSPRLEQLFTMYVDLSLPLCEVYFPVGKALIQVRQGLFFDDEELVNAGLNSMKSFTEDGYELTLKNTRYHYYLKQLGISKKQFNAITGNNLRMERLAYGFEPHQVAQILEVSPDYIELVEKGEKGIITNSLEKLAAAFQIDVEKFYVGLTGIFYNSIVEASAAGKGKFGMRRQLAAMRGKLGGYELKELIDAAKSWGRL